MNWIQDMETGENLQDTHDDGGKQTADRLPEYATIDQGHETYNNFSPRSFTVNTSNFDE